MKRGRGDQGGIVLGWLTKLVIVMAVVGLVGFDLISLGQAHLQTTDRASTAAQAAVDSYQSAHDLQQAFDAAYATLVDGDTIETKTFAIGADGSVSLRLHHHASTLLVEKIGPLRHRASFVATGEAQAIH